MTDPSRLDVVCVGSGTLSEYALDHRASAAPSIALLSNNAPMLLIGAGPGVLRHVLHHLGQVPPSLFLPSAHSHYCAEVQSVIQYEASYGRKLSVFAASEVLDIVIAGIDDDIVTDVRNHVEFLQVDVGTPTCLRPNFFFVVQRADTKAPRFNVCVMDHNQTPILAFIDGPLGYHAIFQQATSVIVRQHRGLVAERLYKELNHAKIFIVGYMSDARIPPPATGLRPGDAFVAPRTKGAHTLTVAADSVVHSPALATSADDSSADRRRPTDPTDEAVYVTNRGRARYYEDLGRTSGDAGWSTDYGAASPSHRFSHSGAPQLQTASRARATSPFTSRRPTSQQSTLQYGRRDQPVEGSREPHHPTHRRLQPMPPRKIYVFNNEVKEAEPVIVMVNDHMTLGSLKSKIGTLIDLKPFGHLFTVDGGLVRDPAELQHCQEVVATKHAGAPFDLNRLPTGMQFVRPATSAEHALAL